MFKHLLPGIALAILALAPFLAQGAPSDKVAVVFDHVLPNVPGKSIRGVLVEYPPGGTTAAHTHPHSAFIYATVLEGAIKSQVNDGPITVYTAGQSPRASWPSSSWTPPRPIWSSTTHPERPGEWTESPCDPPAALQVAPEDAAVTLLASIDVGRIPYAAFSRCRAQCSFARGGLGKALSIVARRDSQYSEERTTHLLFTAEAATFSDSFDSVVRFLKPATRCVNSDRFHRLRGGATALRCIDPCEVSGAHVHSVRQSIDAEVALQMLHYPAFQFAE
jgi:hypothetical protein